MESFKIFGKLCWYLSVVVIFLFFLGLESFRIYDYVTGQYTVQKMKMTEIKHTSHKGGRGNVRIIGYIGNERVYFSRYKLQDRYDLYRLYPQFFYAEEQEPYEVEVLKFEHSPRVMLVDDNELSRWKKWMSIYIAYVALSVAIILIGRRNRKRKDESIPTATVKQEKAAKKEKYRIKNFRFLYLLFGIVFFGLSTIGNLTLIDSVVDLFKNGWTSQRQWMKLMFDVIPVIAFLGTFLTAGVGIYFLTLFVRDSLFNMQNRWIKRFGRDATGTYMNHKSVIAKIKGEEKITYYNIYFSFENEAGKTIETKTRGDVFPIHEVEKLIHMQTFPIRYIGNNAVIMIDTI